NRCMVVCVIASDMHPPSSLLRLSILGIASLCPSRLHCHSEHNCMYPQMEYNNPTITFTPCKARLRFIPSSVLCDARLLPPFLLQIVRLSAVMRPIPEPCKRPQCEQNASPA